MIRPTILASLASAFLCIATRARADEPLAETPANQDDTRSSAAPRTGLELGLRSGFALPFGKQGTTQTRSIYGDLSMRDALIGAVPLRFDFGYRINQAIYAGIYAEIGFGVANNNSFPCNAGATCSASNARLGLEAQYHLAPSQGFDPWVGLGFGYEGLNYKATGSPQGDYARTVRGLELLNVQAGGDLKVGSGLVVGPFLSFSLGKYDYAAEYRKNQLGVETVSGFDIDDTALHEWLLFGLRGAYEL